MAEDRERKELERAIQLSLIEQDLRPHPAQQDLRPQPAQQDLRTHPAQQDLPPRCEDEEVNLEIALQLSLQTAAEQERQRLPPSVAEEEENADDSDQIIPECPVCLVRLRPPLQASYLIIEIFDKYLFKCAK